MSFKSTLKSSLENETLHWRRTFVIAFYVFIAPRILFAQEDSDSLKIDKLRTESGVDPTRVQSRVSYSIPIFDPIGDAGQVGNRLSFNIGVNRWNLSGRYEYITRTEGVPGEGFTSGLGDIRFGMLNAFFVKGRHAVAGSVEFSLPTGKPGFGSGYFSMSPGFTYSFTITQSLFVATQPQFSFDLFKDPLYPELRVLTIRAFLAKFTKQGYFFVFEPRPVIDFTSDTVDLILSPIMGKSIGGGFNLLMLAEFPTSLSSRQTRGNLYQFGFNKNF